MVEYISSDKDCTVSISISAEGINSTPIEIANNLTDKSEYIKRMEKSDRQMWPKSKLTGVKFELNKKGFKGSIKESKIILSCDDYNDIEELHSIVENWAKDTTINIPPLSKFKMYYLLISSVDDNSIVIDSTKNTGEDHPLGKKHTYNNRTGYIDEFKDSVLINFDDNLDIDNGLKYLQDCIDNNIFVSIEDN